MRISTFIWAALGAAFAATASAQTTATENMIRMNAPRNTFYLFDQTSVEMLDYKTDRDLRICLDERRHHVPLEVDYDGKTANIRPGDCFSFEAKHVAIKPGASLGQDLDLRGTIETMEPSGSS
jgi:hypothetical protein